MHTLNICEKPKFDICDPFFYVSAWLFFFIPVKLGIIAISDGWSGYSEMHPYFFEFTLYTGIFTFLLYASYIIFAKSSFFHPDRFTFFKIQKTDHYFTFSRTVIACIAIMVLFQVYLFLVNLSIPQLLSGRLVDFKLAKGSQLSVAVNSLYLVLLELTFFFNIYYLYQGKKNYLSSLLITFTFIFISLFSGSRGMFLNMVLTVILARVVVLRNIPWLKMFAIMSILLVFFGWYDNLRAVNLSNIDFFSFLQRDVHIGDLIMRVLDKRTDSYFPNGPIYLEYQDLFGIRYGYEIIKITLMIIPKSILPDRETFFLQEWNDRMQFQSEGGTSYAPIVEAMINFGVLGVFIYAILGGFFLAFASRMYNHYLIRDNPIGVFFFSKVFIAIVTSGIIAGGYGSPGPINFALNAFSFFIIFTVIKYQYK